MKLKVLLPIVATVILAGAMFFAGCEKEKKAIDESENHINLSSQSNGGSTSACCTVTCGKGRCTAHNSPCHCTCTFLNYPDCHGGCSNVIAIPDSCFDGREYIVLNSDFLTQVADERTLLYSLNKPYATEVADKISDFNDLISTYGYNLNSKQALLDYYEIIDYINERESLFTVEELMLF